MTSVEAFTKLREDGQLEAKDGRGGLSKSIWATYSAFANTQGGTMLIGVVESSNHELIPVGLPDPADTVKKFWDGVNNPKVVSANILVDSDVSITQIDGIDIVEITIPRAPRAIRPVYLNERVLTETYRRNGEGDYHCSEDEIKAMLRDQATGLPDKMPVESAEPDALDPASIEAFRNEASLKRPDHPWNRLTTDEFLIRLGAAARSREDGRMHPTRAGLLMFGWEFEITNEFPFYFLEYREVLSSRRWDFRLVTNDGEWSGGIYDYWSRVYPRLTADIARPFELDKNMSRVEETPLHIALREALANTLIHADYQGRSGTAVIRYDNRATFTNAGSLLLPAEVAMGGGVSEVRNPTIMKMFNFIGIGEKAGSGFDAMRQGCDWAGLEHPILAETFEPSRTILTFPLARSASTAKVAPGDKTNEGKRPQTTVSDPNRETPENQSEIIYATVVLNEDEAVLNLARQRGSIRRTDVESELGIGSTKAKSILSRLVESGELRSEGRGRATRYLSTHPATAR